MVCCKLNGFTMRHHVVADTLASVVKAAGYPCKREVSLPDGSKDRKGKLLRAADVLVTRYDEHSPLAIDVTVRDPLKSSKPVKHDGVEAWHAEQELSKCAKYVTHTNRAKWQFKAFV